MINRNPKLPNRDALNFVWHGLAVIISAGILFLSACSENRMVPKTPRQHSFQDATANSFPKLKGSILSARLTRANSDSYVDLVALREDPKGTPLIEVWINNEDEKFSLDDSAGWKGQPGQKVSFMTDGNFNGDPAADLIIIEQSSSKSSAKILLNNGKGYFYSMEEFELPPIREGIERVDPVDIDRDGTRDLFFAGRNVKGANGETDKYQAQIMINDGRGHFQDATSILLPAMRPGIIGVSFADYDGDDVVDAFIIYEAGPNALLMNNGLGKLSDQTKDRLPSIGGNCLHADWADFDLDGDNDLLVVNKRISEKSKGFSQEYNYILENTGQGYFEKRTLKVLPPYPSRRVYLLDANGSNIPDAIILTQKGSQYLRGEGKWQFARESRKTLPASVHFEELTFGDVNEDGYLDIFGVTSKGKEGMLWVNRIE